LFGDGILPHTEHEQIYHSGNEKAATVTNRKESMQARTGT